MIGIVIPLPQEAAVFQTGSKLIRQPIQLSDSVQLIISGVGAKNAKAAAEIIAPNSSRLISWGTAAGLSKGVHPGTLILPNIVSNENGEIVHTDDSFVENMTNGLSEEVNHRIEILSESSKVLVDKAAKQKFYEQTNATACDMESYTIALVAKKFKIPFNAIRFISDTHTETLPQSVFTSINEDGHLNMLNFLFQLLKNPSEISQIRKLAKNFSAVKKTMRITSRVLIDMKK